MENKRDFERNDTGRDVLTLQQKEAYLKADERLDELHRNAYHIIQNPAKFCFGMDAVLLSGFVKVKAGEKALDLGTGTGIIPILLEETDKIMKAQIARGADLESGNMIQKAKSMIPILVPLFVSAFRRANDLAMAMEARCYRGGEGRTKMKPLKYHKEDRTAYITVIAYVILVVVIGRCVSVHIWVF